MDSNIRPRFEVEKLVGDVEHVVYSRNDDNKLEKTLVKVPAGYMVYLPNGTSIRVRNDTDLKALGFMEEAPLVDMVTGDVVPRAQSLKSRSVQMTAQSRKV